MKSNLTALRLALEEELNSLEDRIPNLLERYKTGARIADQAELRLKELVVQEGFDSQEEEIQFFKHLQPAILSKKIYYSQLFRIEADRPKGIREEYKKFLDQEMQRITMFFEEHNALDLYYRGGARDKDEQYFLRSSRYNNEYPVDLEGMLDTRFCTVTSFKLAELMALESVSGYLVQKLEQLYALPRSVGYKQQLRWTDTKINLVELVYAMYFAGSFNNGRAELKQIFEWLEQSLDVDIGNAYSNFRDIRMRKKDYASFLTHLKDCLLKKIGEMEEVPRK
ncbi:RteC domain-containing protein [Chitinophaga lutea]